jgi:hypothetical protein
MQGLRDSGNTVQNPLFFDTIKVIPRIRQSEVKLRAVQKKINLRYLPDGSVAVALDETVTKEWPTLLGLLLFFTSMGSFYTTLSSLESATVVSGAGRPVGPAMGVPVQDDLGQGGGFL